MQVRNKFHRYYGITMVLTLCNDIIKTGDMCELFVSFQTSNQVNNT